MDRVAQVYWLGVGFLQQGAPELVVVLRVAVDEFPVDRRQPVVHHHVHPLPEHPELKVEDSGVALRVFRVPLLILVIRNHLEITHTQKQGVKRGPSCGIIDRHIKYSELSGVTLMLYMNKIITVTQGMNVGEINFHTQYFPPKFPLQYVETDMIIFRIKTLSLKLIQSSWGYFTASTTLILLLL